jgi:Pumilio-family RNA binding repeat
MTTINVVCPEGVLPMEITLELACSLILIKGQTDMYTVQDIISATSALKKFRDIQDPDLLPSTPEVTESLLPNPFSDEVNILLGGPDYYKMALDAKGSTTVQEALVNATSPEARVPIVSQLCKNAYSLATHAHGCRVFQKALDIGSLEERLAFSAAIPQSKVLDCCLDVNANHVMQKFIEVLPSAFSEFIVEAIATPFSNTIARLSLHCYGCRVIQRIISRCDLEQKERVLDGVVAAVGEMITDQFGNYVVQHALEFGREVDRVSILTCIANRDLVLLSCNKFASNVVEKAARVQSPAVRILVNALCALSTQQTLEIMRDRYGNYVTRAFLELPVHKFPQLSAIKDLVKEHAGTLKKYTYGWHLVEHVHKPKGGQSSY